MKTIPLLAALLLAAAPGQAQDQLVGTMTYWIDSYCVFQRVGEPPARYGQPETFRFVFFTEFGQQGNVDDGSGYIVIKGHLHELAWVDTVQGKDGETRQYRSFGDDPYTVFVTRKQAGTGYENTDYTGTILVDGPGGHDFVEVTGSCGV
jgi:hypothetical protein